MSGQPAVPEDLLTVGQLMTKIVASQKEVKKVNFGILELGVQIHSLRIVSLKRC